MIDKCCFLPSPVAVVQTIHRGAARAIAAWRGSWRAGRSRAIHGSSRRRRAAVTQVRWDVGAVLARPATLLAIGAKIKAAHVELIRHGED